ncbi:hypothetical protein WN51_11562 [Melipona quadrifasciata]|uniref:Uncharacterized protein n=1 Tax=Melipona quadrifasciata TaxID=166423 RepID=A0A0M9A5A5_9HYME|nr:hypothetical protein WN51_11562 [Melipona quadrifasciata]
MFKPSREYLHLTCKQRADTNTCALLILLWTLALANSADLHVDSREVLTVYGSQLSALRFFVPSKSLWDIGEIRKLNKKFLLCLWLVQQISVQLDHSAKKKRICNLLRKYVTRNKENLTIEFELKIEEGVRSLQKCIKYHYTVASFILVINKMLERFSECFAIFYVGIIRLKFYEYSNEARVS